MFFDPTCKPEVKADPFSLESLIAWLEKQPADETYVWECIDGGCLVGRYGLAMGMGHAWHDCHSEFARRGQLSIAHSHPRTFGAALQRARKFAAASRI